MTHVVLSRKLRPKTFDDVVGQEVIIRSLKNSISRDRIGHAYIFSGTRGVGKTSVARIFAKSLNCQNRNETLNPCMKCSSCLEIETSSSLDFLEIDGASHNSVDDVREIISNVHTLPTSGKYKIYIIDEVHMLSISAFNALLKTLEEPPEHIVFILATTEPDKLPKTVLSRCQRFDFKQASPTLLVEYIKKISQTENIKFENDNLILKICRQGKGSIRDTLSLLDQVLSFSENSNITDEVMSSSLGLADDATIQNILRQLVTGKNDQMIKSLNDMLVANIPIENITLPLLDHLYGLVTLNNEVEINGTRYSQEELIWIYEGLVKDFGWLESASAAEKYLSIILLKYCKRRDFLSVTNTVSAQPQEEVKKKFELVDFLQYLSKSSPALSFQLEHGNLKSSDWSSDRLKIDWLYNSKNLVFFESTTEEENIKKLEEEVRSFVAEENLKVIFNIIHDENDDLPSLAEIRELERLKEKELKRQRLLSNEFVKEAEMLFGTRVDKVNIED